MTISHEVAYFSFGAANPDGAEHLRSRGNNIFGFEDLPGNLPNKYLSKINYTFR
jgi:hypothetical protein